MENKIHIYAGGNKNEKKLIDYLENNVDEKYYITQKSMIKAIEQKKIKVIDKLDNNAILSTITTKQMRWNNAGVILEKIKIPFSTFNQENYITDPENGKLGTITATGANSKQKILIEIPEQNFKNYLYIPNKNGEIKGDSYNRVWKNNYIGTINTTDKIKILTEVKQKDKLVIKYNNKFYNVRVITPKEAFRLMGFSDLDYSRAKEVISENQLYKVAGNSIVVPVMEEIIKLMDLPLEINFLDLFAGIGAVEKALINLGYKIINRGIIEKDKNAIKAYNSIHETNFQDLDIKDFKYKGESYDYIHASTPYQPFSVAGKNLGEKDKRGFDLWFHTLLILKYYKPKFFTLENVKGLIQEKHKDLLEWFIIELEKMNYEVAISLINAKYFIPQNRDRVFIIAKRRDNE